MKKLSVVLLGLVLGLLFLNPAFACPGARGPVGDYGYGYGPGYCYGTYYPNAQAQDERIEQARQEFLAKTRELRQQLYDRKTTYYDLLARDNPNKAEAAKLWNEIFDIQSRLRKIAAEEGFSPNRWRARLDGDGGFFGPGCVRGGGRWYGPVGGYGLRGGYYPGCYGPRGCW